MPIPEDFGTTKPGTVVAAYLHAGDVSHSFHHSCRNLWIWDVTHHQRVTGFIAQECGAGRITDGRNTAVHRFLATDSEWLLFVDADMGFEPDAVDQLVAVADPERRPVVGALCFGQRRGAAGPAGSVRLQQFPTIYQWVMGAGISGCAPMHEYPPNALVECDGTGAAFLLIHRSVFERMRESYPEPRPWFDEMIQQGRPFGEDLTFCWRLRELDIPLHVHTGVQTSHYKTTYLTAESQPLLDDIPTYVVIPMKDRADLTRQLVEQLVDQAEAAGIFVIDNGSVLEESKQILAELAELPGVLVASMPDANIHQMWNAGMNESVRRSWPCNIAILNNDIKIGERFLSGMARELRRDPLLAVVCPNYDGRAGDGVEYVEDICAGRMDGTGGLAGFAFMLKAESEYRFPEELQWWFGDNDMMCHVAYGGSRAGIVLGTTVEHVDGGSQTADWNDAEMQKVLDADRKWFEAKWRPVASRD